MTPQLSEFLQQDGHDRPEAFDYAISRMFAGVPLQGARVLEIGSGKGLLALTLAARGASRVVSLEPELEGSTSGVVAIQRRRVQALGLADRVEVVVADFNTWETDERFDVVVSRASLNHLYPTDQHAAYSVEAWAGYLAVARRIHRLLAPGGVCVAIDACRYSLFGLGRSLGLRRPWRRSRSGVDWRHHQTPATWQRLFRAAGFTSAEIRYPVGYPLRHLQALAGTRLANACLKGNFILQAKA